MDNPENQNCRPEWQTRLLDERKELKTRLDKIEAALCNNEMKLSYREWNLIEEQARAMRHYYNVLSERCCFYDLIESGCATSKPACGHGGV